jgi:hypothetical protein
MLSFIDTPPANVAGAGFDKWQHFLLYTGVYKRLYNDIYYQTAKGWVDYVNDDGRAMAGRSPVYKP